MKHQIRDFGCDFTHRIASSFGPKENKELLASITNGVINYQVFVNFAFIFETGDYSKAVAKYNES